MMVKKYSLLIFAFSFLGCNTFLEEDLPAGTVESSTIFSSDAKAKAAIDGIYGNLVNTNGFARWWTTLYAGYSSDELTKNNPDATSLEFMTNELTASNAIIKNIWTSIYNNLYYANIAIANLKDNTIVTEDLRKQLLGESLIIRAFCHFYSAVLFGNAVMVNSPDYVDNSHLTNSTATDIYAFAETDLKEAVNLLDGATYSTDRVSRWAGLALLARIYLNTKQWEKAFVASNEIIANGPFALSGNLNTVFDKYSQEAIWQLAQTAGLAPEYQYAFRVLGTPTNRLSNNFTDIFSSDDLRKKEWLTEVTVSESIQYIPSKYKNAAGTQFQTVFRLSEQYLIRAETSSYLNKIDQSLDDLNKIRNRAGIYHYFDSHDPELLRQEIYQERKRELFSEWGLRWIDLKRNGTFMSEMQSIKPNVSLNDTIYPIPASEIISNIKLKQNNGY